MKPKVVFKIDYRKDAWNYWNCADSEYPEKNFERSNPELYKRISGKTWNEVKDFLFDYLKPKYQRDQKLFELVIGNFSDVWKLIENEYFGRLEQIMKKPVYFEEITAYLTTRSRCPYNTTENWFMVSLFGSALSARVTCAHEIMHFIFHKYYWETYEKQIGKSKIWDLKEALTVLLNEEFRDLLILYDKSKEGHEKLRKYISEEWHKCKNFDVLLNRCIRYLNKN